MGTLENDLDAIAEILVDAVEQLSNITMEVAESLPRPAKADASETGTFEYPSDDDGVLDDLANDYGPEPSKPEPVAKVGDLQRIETLDHHLAAMHSAIDASLIKARDDLDELRRSLGAKGDAAFIAPPDAAEGSTAPCLWVVVAIDEDSGDEIYAPSTDDRPACTCKSDSECNAYGACPKHFPGGQAQPDGYIPWTRWELIIAGDGRHFANEHNGEWRLLTDPSVVVKSWYIAELGPVREAVIITLPDNVTQEDVAVAVALLADARAAESGAS